MALLSVKHRAQQPAAASGLPSRAPLVPVRPERSEAKSKDALVREAADVFRPAVASGPDLLRQLPEVALDLFPVPVRRPLLEGLQDLLAELLGLVVVLSGKLHLVRVQSGEALVHVEVR